METGPGATTAAKCIRQLSTGEEIHHWNVVASTRAMFVEHRSTFDTIIYRSRILRVTVRENKISFFRPLGHSKRLVSNILQRKYKHQMRNIFQQSSLCWWLDINMAGCTILSRVLFVISTCKLLALMQNIFAVGFVVHLSDMDNMISHEILPLHGYDIQECLADVITRVSEGV